MARKKKKRREMPETQMQVRIISTQMPTKNSNFKRSFKHGKLYIENQVSIKIMRTLQ